MRAALSTVAVCRQRRMSLRESALPRYGVYTSGFSRGRRNAWVRGGRRLRTYPLFESEFEGNLYKLIGQARGQNATFVSQRNIEESHGCKSQPRLGDLA